MMPRPAERNRPRAAYPREPEIPGRPLPPGRPGPLPPGAPTPGAPGRPGPSPASWPGAAPAPQGDFPGRIYERLLDHRIVMAHGFLDVDAATRLSAQLLTLDAEGRGPIRLELQNLDGDLGAALTVMGVLATLRAEVIAQAGGRIGGPALGVLAAAHRRRAYPSAVFALSEPNVSFEGAADAVAAQEEQLRSMLDELYDRLSEVTGREVDAIRADARRDRVLTAEQAVGYGLIEETVRKGTAAG